MERVMSNSQTSDESNIDVSDAELLRWNDLRVRLCSTLARKAKKYIDDCGCPPDLLEKWISTDFSFYGGDKIFDEGEKEGVIAGAYAYAMEDYTLPE
jgi:hypothetical protein